MDGWTDGWTNGWMDERMERQMDGRTDPFIAYAALTNPIISSDALGLNVRCLVYHYMVITKFFFNRIFLDQQISQVIASNAKVFDHVLQVLHGMSLSVLELLEPLL